MERFNRLKGGMFTEQSPVETANWSTITELPTIDKLRRKVTNV
jgi:hypothetical protein